MMQPALFCARRWAHHGWIGLALIAVAWPLNWGLPGMRTHWLFFPLWLGYCLVVDAATVARKGSSLLTRGPAKYVGLFAASVPGWWLFELINQRTHNWVYLSDGLSAAEHFLLASLSFSTVTPAVLGTAELIGCSGLLSALRHGPTLAARHSTMIAWMTSGLLMLGLVLTWPRYFFPLVWISVYVVVEPLNVWLGHRTLLERTADGDWREVAAVGIGCLVCGFFWEAWNFYSYPRWTYRVPFVDWLRLFEMPILGYGGYLPFALEVYALYHLLASPFAPRRLRGYLQVVE